MPSPRNVRSASRTGVMLTRVRRRLVERMNVPWPQRPGHDAEPQVRGHLIGQLLA